MRLPAVLLYFDVKKGGKCEKKLQNMKKIKKGESLRF
jgi:hypothetical protein